ASEVVLAQDVPKLLLENDLLLGSCDREVTIEHWREVDLDPDVAGVVAELESPLTRNSPRYYVDLPPISANEETGVAVHDLEPGAPLRRPRGLRRHSHLSTLLKAIKVGEGGRQARQ